MRKLLGVAALIVLVAGCGGGGRPDAADAPIVVIGIDSADWTWIDERLAEGGMPHLAALLARGVRADLPSLQPPQKSPTIWTTIATGMRPSRHGIADFITHERGITGSAMRQVPTYWEILGATGRSQAVIGWWVTFPATPVNGVLVTDYLQYGAGRDQMIEASIFPDSAWDLIAPLRVDPATLPRDELGRFVNLAVADSVGEVAERHLADLSWMYAGDQSYRQIARALYEDARDKGAPFDVFTVYFRGLDVVSHRFWNSFRPGQGGVGAEDWEVEMLGGLIPAYLEYVDELIGEIVAYTDPRSRILICSDHGFFGNRRRAGSQARGVGMHDDDGILVVAGPGVRRGVVLDQLESDVHDITPTLLSLAGLPPALDMDGKVIMEIYDSGYRAFAEALPEDAIESYEAIVPEHGGVAGAADPEIEAEALEKLKALGYIE